MNMYNLDAQVAELGFMGHFAPGHSTSGGKQQPIILTSIRSNCLPFNNRHYGFKLDNWSQWTDR